MAKYIVPTDPSVNRMSKYTVPADPNVNRMYGEDFEITYIGVLHARTRRALIRAGITTLGQLRESIAHSMYTSCPEVPYINGIGNVGWYDIYQLLGLEWPWRTPKQRES